MLRIFFSITAFISITLLAAQPVSAQAYRIKGTVYDSSRSYPMEGVSVLSTSGKGTATNKNGYYEIEVTEKDSIWFSYLNKPTVKFPVLKIMNQLAFDISLQVNVPVLKEVRIRPPNYKLDSIRNREDYAKIFDFRKPKLKPELTPNGFGAGVGFDLDEIINMFRFKHNKSMLDFQRRLLTEEQEKFIDHRFSKALVRRLTKLNSPELDSFMLIYRPSYMFAQLASDYDFQKYIKDSYVRFKKGLSPAAVLKPQENNF
ncbi:MAG: carboxypeptidase-like regulatory domain-containing protein [Chitinophagales bacterium]